MKRKQKLHFFSSTLPALLFGAASGCAASVIVTLFKWAAGKAVALSELLYHADLIYLPILLAFLFGAAWFYAFLYRHEPELQGGGVPTSVGAMRGLLRLKPLRNILGVFLLSLLTFALGVPLGTEGPSVQMGAAVGSGLVLLCGKKWRAWDRIATTGGASAGFSVALGAPLSGIVFSIEEAHHSVTPMIVLTAITSVLSASVTTRFLSPRLGVSTALFSLPALPALSLRQLWIPFVVGAALGLYTLAFFGIYRLLAHLFTKKLSPVSQCFKLFGVLAVTLLCGILSHDFISTGHHFIQSLFDVLPAFGMLLLIVLVRSLLTLGANTAGMTGGIFLPQLAIGAAAAAAVAALLHSLGLPETYTSLIVALGICACIAGMMKMPLTAILFAVEGLGLGGNLPAVVLTAAIAFAIPECLGGESIAERVLERRHEARTHGKPEYSSELDLTVCDGAFAVGKEVRDILWPAGVRILNVQYGETPGLLSAGDTLRIYYQTHDYKQLRSELSALLE
ncbi:MAG: chloride channel protein [Oscillospiraceae bacterium]|nr:chloride channel protein [Oscillospiraceae bacterium]